LLVIDDDPAIRELMVLTLSDEGYAVDVAEDGQVGLDLVGSCLPDAILVDLIMPALSGLDFVRAYRQRPGSSARIILMTAASPNQEAVLDAAVDEVLPKPFDIDELIAVVRRVLNRA
jgi:DNA-binding response OmpR family regulator